MTQLAKAGESTGNNVIVCLTDQREKEDMENDIVQCDFNFSNVGTRVVCRAGSPLAYHELKKVSFWRAKSIIILGDDEHDVETNDARSLQILLSIVAALERERANFMERCKRLANRDGLPKVFQKPDRIVIEVMDTENAAIMKSVCPEIVEPVLAHDVVGRLLLQAARNPLVADVWQELLGFDGCEIYSNRWALIIGMKFKEVLLCFEDAIPLGVKKTNGDLVLNPPDNYVVKEGDELIVLAEDDDTYCPSLSHRLISEKVRDPDEPSGYRDFEICPGGQRSISHFQRLWCNRMPTPQVDNSLLSQEVEKILFCGWRFDMGNLLDVFSAIAPAGSEFWILCELPEEERESALRLRGWQGHHNIKVVHVMGSCRRNILANIPLEQFTSVIVGTSELAAISKPNNDSPDSGDSGSTSKAEVAGGPDARVITVVMMIQDIITRRQEERKAAAAARNLLRVIEMPDDRRAPGTSIVGPRRSSSMSISRARSQRFLGSKNNSELYAPRGVVVGEIVDSRSRAMLSMVNAIDAVVASSELISKAVAMVSEDTSVNHVLNTLFDPYDSEITLEGVDRYVNLVSHERVSFYELLARGRKLGTIVLGYLVREEGTTPGDLDPSSTIQYTDVALNPPRKDLRRNWHPDDLLIVLTPGTGSVIAAPTGNNTEASGSKPPTHPKKPQQPKADSLDPDDDPDDFLEDVASVQKLDFDGQYGKISFGEEPPKSYKRDSSGVRFGNK